jgi:DNA-binding transcriptional regulator YhcF (GntR family)/DNA-binding XRE family transcriptional regulator
VIFIDMCKIHRHGSEHCPSNNGQIGYGYAAGAKAASVSVTTAYRMLEDLRDSGLIKLQKKGVFRVKAGEGRVTEWEITIYPIAGHVPTAWGEGRLHIEHWLLESAAYQGLSNQAKCILIELMRRYDGGNNGAISFGGSSGAYAGFSVDVTERALTELQRTGFIAQTAPAVPYLRRPRQWQLTMYASDSKPATKDFMRGPKPTRREKSDHGFTGADDSGMNVSMMRSSFSSNQPIIGTATSFIAEKPFDTNAVSVGNPNLDSRTGETFHAADTRTNEIHLEASLPALSEADFAAAKPSVRARPSEIVLERSAGLFGDALPSVLTPLDRLRLELRGVLARKRGTQSRVAEALGLSRQTFANALSGRERFTATAVAALCRWLDGKPISEGWPPLPPMEEPNAA